MSTIRRVFFLSALASGCASPSDTHPADSTDTGDTGAPDTADTGGSDTADSADTGTVETGETGVDTADTGESPADPDLPTLGDWIDTETEWTGDTTCLGAPWEAPEAVCQVDFSLSGSIADFQTGDPAAGVDWSLWRTDDPVGTPDATGSASRSGTYSMTAPSCTAVTVATAGPAASGWLPTFAPHTVWPYANLGAAQDDLSVVSSQTAVLVAALLGTSWDDATTGIVSGQVTGCDGEPLGGAQVVVVDAEGHAPTGAGAWYFDDTNFPVSRGRQSATHPDNGMFVIVGVPDGEWRVFAFGWDGTAYVDLGAAALTVSAGSFTMLDIYAGHEDGVSYPAICFAPCDQIN